jgi:DNA-binding MarR family transcriptional regulator
MRSPDSPEDQLGASVCFALYTSMQATLQLYRELLAPWGLSFQQLLVLAVVWERGSASPGEIATVLQLDSSSVSGLLSRMEAADLVIRENSRTDRRAVTVIPTDHSLDIKAQLTHIEGCVVDAMQMESADAENLVAALASLRTSIRGYRPEQTARIP